MAEPDKPSEPEAPEASDAPELPVPAASSGAAASDAARESTAPAGSASPSRSWIPLAIAVAFPVIFFFILPPLTKSGLWDPYELNVADLARRIALNLHGAQNLALEGADNSLPYLNDLGRPQLSFTSIALGFKLFGLHEWAGRAPLALWGVLGVLATYGFVSRLVDKRAGVFAAIALTTMPLYFVQARTMLGDIVTMSALAMAFGGLLVAALGGAKDGKGDDIAGRGAWLVIGVLGLVAGFYSRGGLLGVGVPCLGVGLAWALAVLSGGASSSSSARDGLGLLAGGLSLVAGGAALAFAVKGLGGDRSTDLNPWVGAMIRPPGKYPTFDFTVGHVAMALAPWSAFVPFAIGRMFVQPVDRSPAAHERESHARLALVVGAGVAFAAHGWMAARTDLVAFAGPAILAAMCGIALRDYERGAHPSVAVGVGTAVLLGLFHHELHNMPEKAFNAFSIVMTTFPESYKASALSLWTVVLVGFAGLGFLTWVERDADRVPFEPRGYLKVLLALRDAWDGMLALAYFAMVAGASLAGLAVWLGTRQHWKWLPTLSTQMREAVLHGWWVTAFVPLGIIFGIYFWCDVWLWAFGRASANGVTSLATSATRGFEPFEVLAQRLREGNLSKSLPNVITGKTELTEETLEEGVGPTALFIVAPLMYLQVPAAVFLVLSSKLGLKWYVAAALAIPSGVALFLLLGFLGDVFRRSRAGVLALFGATVGAVLCFSYYPALANQLSPKEVFESYQHVKKGNEPLALFGVGGRTAAYYAGGQPLILRDATSAYDWLMGGAEGSRRFLAVRTEELGRLNRTYRERVQTTENIPVLDSRSSQIILVTSKLASGEKNQNPLSRIIMSAPPAKIQRKLDANLEDKLQVLGFDIVDGAGRLVDHVSPGKTYHMRTYFKVLAPLQTEWQMFIHIDGYHRRHNGDHAICEGKYPMSLWLKDDILMDDHEFKLEPNFTPGNYNIYFGLFVGESRLKTKGGPSDSENRVNGGILKVQ